MNPENNEAQQQLNDLYTMAVAKTIGMAQLYLDKAYQLITTPSVEALSAEVSFELATVIKEFQGKVDELLRKELSLIIEKKFGGQNPLGDFGAF